MVFGLSISSCSDDKDFNYPEEMLLGTWDGTDIKIDGKWTDITSPIYYKFWFSVKFNSDGTYYGSGFFGTGKGTYKAEKDMIYTYVDKKEYARYKVLSMSDTKAELTMYIGDESFDIRVAKKK